MLEINKIHQGDCLELMKEIEDKSIDMILCDLPYGITSCKWDAIIPFDKLWKQYKRIIKDNGAIVLTSSQPFTSTLIMSNPKMFKYNWVWEKHRGGNFVLANYQPLRVHEDICVFGNFPVVNTPSKIKNYNPQMKQGEPYSRGKINSVTWNGKKVKCGHTHDNKTGLRYPRSIIKFNKKSNGSLHPTQKPVALFEYLIKTYTNEGDLVLDNCAGSGTTGVACRHLNRNFILIELEEKYVKIANERLSQQVLSNSIVPPSNSATQVSKADEHNISLKESSHEDSQISSNDETSLNNNIPRLHPNFKFHSTALK